MSESVSIGGLKLTLNEFKKLKSNIKAEYIAAGPLVHMTALENDSGEATSYKVTVLSYVPSGKDLEEISNRTGLKLKGKKIYLNYDSTYEVKAYDNADGSSTPMNCRNFFFEFKCNDKEEISKYDLYYTQFSYSLNDGTASVDAVLVRDKNDDPTTSRGGVAFPTNP